MSAAKTDRFSILEDEGGFSLAELLTAFAVLALVLAGITAIQSAAQRAYLNGATKTEVDQNARIALDRIATHIRESTGPLTEATATSIAFTIPFPVTGAPTAVRYALDGTNLTCTGLCDNQTLSAQPVMVAGGVRSLALVYIPAGAVNSITRVDITIQTQSENTLIAGSGDAYDARSQITTSARLRNM